jgi:hypothetical protein
VARAGPAIVVPPVAPGPTPPRRRGWLGLLFFVRVLPKQSVTAKVLADAADRALEHRADFASPQVTEAGEGETLDEREASRTFDVVGRQPEAALRRLTPDEAAAAVIAYEPVWAIGTGRTATPDQAQEVHAFIRREIARSHGDAVAGAIRILYGGSVKPDNAAALLAQADVDGALVGGACLEADSFLKIVRAGA